MTPVLIELDDPGTGRKAMIKDSIDVAGVPTKGGSRALATAPAAKQDAEAVALLRQAGWRITGKTKLHELAFGVTGINLHDGTPTNPRWPELVPGGSSSGSAAAVAAGLVPMALGTDTGGSIRIPSACCGVFGLKPTFGLVSRKGAMPDHTTLDCVGPFACDMETLVDAMKAIAPGFEVPALEQRLRIGVLEVDAAPEVVKVVEQALANWAQSPSQVELLDVRAPSFKAAFDAGLAIINAETWAATKDLMATGLVGEDIAIRLRRASQTTPEHVAASEVVRKTFTAEIDALLEGCTVLALPVMAALPPKVVDAGDTSAAVAMTSLVRQFNLSGHPAISLPLNIDGDGPVALQLVARKGADGLLCAVAMDAVHALGLVSTASARLVD